MSAASNITSPSPTASREGMLRAAGETFLLFVLFFLLAGGPAPEVNESHYLCKAKHYWNPAWGRNDFFLNSSDAHAVFYWTFGWITQFLSLTASAWVGRCVVWLFLAWAWQRLSRALVDRSLASLLSGALFASLLARTHMAGEWVIGGVEAKGFAYGFVLLGMEAIVRGRLHCCWPLFGAAAAFHVIVGGWAVLAGMFAWLAMRRPLEPARSVPLLILGFLLSLPGLLPCVLLNQGEDPEIVGLGNVIYVYVRLEHHLVFHRWPPMFVVRHALLIVTTCLLLYPLRSHEKFRRLAAFAAGAVLLAMGGIVIDLLSHYTTAEFSAGLLRYYWYRLSDAVVPMTAALALTRLALPNDAPSQTSRAGLLIGLMLMAAAHVVDVQYQRRLAPLPDGHLPADVYDAKGVEASTRRFNDWEACCRWIEANTPADAIFLTPRGQQTFKWFAQRAEVVSWKDAPQDSRGLVDWLRRFEDVHSVTWMEPPQVDSKAPYDERLRLLAEKYDADYLVVDRAAAVQPQKYARAYPRGDDFNASFAVYRLRGGSPINRTSETP